MQTAAACSPDVSADAFGPYRVVGSAFAVLSLLVAVSQLGRNLWVPSCTDFISFWGAARLAAAGTPALAYDNAILHQLQSAVVDFAPGAEMPFPYMPAFLLVLVPFSVFPFGVAMMLWVAATFAAYLVILRRLVPNAWFLALGFPAVLVNAAVGQNGFLTAAVFLSALLILQRRPLVAGLVIGLLVIKPQLAILFPVALLASRQWRAVIGAAISSTAVTLAGILVFGTQPFLAWIDQLPLYGRIAREGLVGWVQFTSVYAAGRQAGLDSGAAFGLHISVATAAIVAVWRIWRSDSDMLTKGAVLACATALISPYMFLYDQLLLTIAFVWAVRRNAHPALVALLWCLPMVSIAQHFTGAGFANLGPVTPITLLAMIIRRTRAEDQTVARTAVPVIS